MRFLVTGANGFVGQYLRAELLRRGQSVRSAIRAERASDGHIDVAVIGAMNSETNWSDALHEVDVVIHLAARVHIMKDEAIDPLAEFLKVNLQGTANLASQAAAAGVKRFVYVSSIKVNGEQTGEMQPFVESGQPEPQDAYAISKWEAERALHALSEKTDMEMVIVRPPLVYGPGVKGNFASLLAAVQKGIPLPLSGINNKRSLIYVGNLADALIACATHPAAARKTYLVCDGEDVSITGLVQQMAICSGVPARLFPMPQKWLRGLGKLFGKSESIERIIGSLCVSNHLICKELNWKPVFTLQQGLKATALWHKKG